jgi:hypothetical protein
LTLFNAEIELYNQLKYPFKFKQGIEISVEDGNTSANAKPIPLSTHLELVSSSSGPIVTFEHKSSSQVSLLYGRNQTFKLLLYLTCFCVFFVIVAQ